MNNCIEVEGIKYDVSHLVPFEFEASIPDKIKGKHIEATVSVFFSNHCYTSKYNKDSFSNPLLYERGNPRYFSKERFFLSEDLPELLKKIATSEKCFFATSRNFFMATARVGSQYRVFFSIVRLGAKTVKMQVESAYIPDTIEKKKRNHIKGFLLIAKVLRGEKIKNPSK